MNKKKVCGIALVLLLLLGGSAIWFFRGNESPEFTHVKRLQDKLIHDETISDQERDDGWQEVKQKWSSFSAEEQQKLAAQHNNKKQAGIAEYFALDTDEERLAHIDRVIDEWDAKAAKNDKKSVKKNKKNDSDETKKKSSRGSGGKMKPDADAMRDGLRNYLAGKSADERAKERIYWTRVKQRWAERHGRQK